MENFYSDSKISAKRIWQIRKIITSINDEDLDSIISDVKDSSKAIIYETRNQSNYKKSKRKEEYLRQYINNYISDKNNNELLELITIVEYYEKIMDRYSWDIEEENVYVWDYINIPLWKRLERLFLYGTLLPNSKTKNEFFEEMDWLVNRLKNNLEKQAKDNWFLIRYLNPEILMDFIVSDWFNDMDYEVSYWTDVKNSYLKSINFNLSLPQLNETENWFRQWPEMSNHIKFELVLSKDETEWVSKEELLDFLKKKWYKSDWDIFFLTLNDHIQIKLLTYNKIINSNWSERFSVEIYSQVQKNNISTEQYVDLSLHQICYKTEELINEIYKEFWHPKEPFIFDLEMLIDQAEEIDEDLDWEYWIVKVKSNVSENKDKKNDKNTDNKDKKSKITEIILKNEEQEVLDTIIDEINHPDDYTNSWIKPTKWLILHGPVGTWKTLFAQHISEKIEWEFMVIKPTDILNEYVWVSERNLQKKFEEARKLLQKSEHSRVVMFFDEADSLFEKSVWHDNHKWWMINVFLTATDWIDKNFLDNILIVFTTNRINMIPEAILDRLNLKLKIDLPNKTQRLEHFKLNIENINQNASANNFSQIDYELLANKTEWKSGRFINRLIENTVRHYVRTKRKHEKDENFLIHTQDIIDWIKLVEALESSNSKEIWFHANIK